MFATTFLKNEEENFKDFSLIVPSYLNHEKFIPAGQKIKKFVKETKCFIRAPNFTFSDGSVYLNHANIVYCLEHIPHKTDLILPKDIQMHDWITLFYEQTTVIINVSEEKRTPIKIRGNGRRIMGLDEPLICDMPFMSLRLTFLGDIDGWVVT